MDKIKDGWFSELSELWPGQSMSLEVQEVLFNEKSKYQNVLVFKRFVDSKNCIQWSVQQFGHQGYYLFMRT